MLITRCAHIPAIYILHTAERLLEVSTGASGGQTLFLEDPQISFEMHQQLTRDKPLRALLRRGFSHPLLPPCFHSR